MIKKFYLLPVLLFVLLFTACDETEEIGKYDNWQARNEAFIDSLQQVYDSGTDPELKKVVYSRDKKVNIFYKKLQKSPLSPEPVNTEAPFYTSTVKMAYRGMFIDEAVFAKAASPHHYTTLYKELYVFDGNMTGDYYDPQFDSYAEFGVGSTIGGWTELLQIMKPGDRVELYIPYQAAYGTEDRSNTDGNISILGYSTLIFDLEMLDVKEY